MRIPLAAALLVFGTQMASAQVTSSDQSIDSLKPAQSGHKATPAQAATHKSKHKAKSAAPAPSHTRPASLAKAAPQVPPAPPANPVIAPPPIVLPTHPPPPPPVVPVKPNAVGTASPIADGTRVTFGAGQSDLNPDTLAAIRALAADALANPAMTIAVTAWAPGTADDPSTPRRLSLDRALAARAVLINAGLASERIRAIAKGMNDIGQLTPDRVEVVKILAPPAAKK